MWSRRYCDVDTFLPIQFGNQLFVQVDVNVVSSVLRCGHVSSYIVWKPTVCAGRCKCGLVGTAMWTRFFLYSLETNCLCR